MKLPVYIGLLLLAATSCKKTEEVQQTETVVTDTLPTPTNTRENEPLVFEKQLGEGIIIDKTLPEYDANFNETGTLATDGFKKVQILEVTTKMVNLKNSTDYCERAHFVKIKLNNKDHIVFGRQVFKIDSKSIFAIQDAAGDKFSIFSATAFEMGASDDNGLTDCDEYSMVLIENTSKQTLSLINAPSNKEHRDQMGIKSVVLFNDQGSSEEIYKAAIVKDTLVVGIKATYQEGGGLFNIKSALRDNFSKSIITDYKRFEEDQMEELKKIK